MPEARFQDIPIPRWELVSALSAEADDDRASLDQVMGLLTVVYQLELQSELEALKRAYAPFNPELDRRVPSRAQTPSPTASHEFGALLQVALSRGNYQRLTDDDIVHAFAAQSLFPIHVAVDMSVYEDVLIYARGETVHTTTIPWLYGLRRKTIEVPTFDRVCIYVRFKPAVPRTSNGGALPYEPGTSLLKLFRNIPKADLEMLFPNCRPTMRPADKLLFGIPALLGGVPVLLKLFPAALALTLLFGIRRGDEVDVTALMTGITGLVVLGGYLYRQWDKYKNRRILFGKVLTENLYFRNLDSNEGVLTRIVDEADDEECKEALLAYVFALRAGGLVTEEQLDQAIEDWLRERYTIEADFEIVDALAKLEALGLVERDGSRVRARPLTEVRERLAARIDALSGTGAQASTPGQ